MMYVPSWKLWEVSCWSRLIISCRYFFSHWENTVENTSIGTEKASLTLTLEQCDYFMHHFSIWVYCIGWWALIYVSWSSTPAICDEWCNISQKKCFTYSTAHRMYLELMLFMRKKRTNPGLLSLSRSRRRRRRTRRRKCTSPWGNMLSRSRHDWFVFTSGNFASNFIYQLLLHYASYFAFQFFMDWMDSICASSCFFKSSTSYLLVTWSMSIVI